VEVHRVETTHRLVESLEISRTAEHLVEVPVPAPPLLPAAESRRLEAPRPAESAGAVPAAPDVPISVVAEPRVAAAVVQPAAPAPPLVIEIDRIDIRIESPVAAPPPPTRRRDTAAAPALGEYLERRSGASR
jgi:hypothetical protein